MGNIIMSLFLVCEHTTKSLPQGFLPFLLIAIISVVGIMLCFIFAPETDSKQDKDRFPAPTITERDIEEIVIDKKNERVGIRRIHERTRQVTDMDILLE